MNLCPVIRVARQSTECRSVVVVVVDIDRGAVLEYRWSCDLAASAFNSFSLAASLSSSMFCWHVSAHLLRVDQSLAPEQSLDVLHVIHSLLLPWWMLWICSRQESPHFTWLLQIVVRQWLAWLSSAFFSTLLICSHTCLSAHFSLWWSISVALYLVVEQVPAIALAQTLQLVSGRLPETCSAHPSKQSIWWPLSGLSALQAACKQYLAILWWGEILL